MMHYLGLTFVISGFALNVFGRPQCNESDNLQDCLLQRYNRYMRPKSELHRITTINISLHVLSIDELDLKHQTVTAAMYLAAKWNDDRLKWNASDVFRIDFELEKLWRPTLVLASLSESLLFLNLENTFAEISSEGIVSIYPYFKVTLGTELDVTRYPFDFQTISFIFEDWSNSIENVIFFIDEDFSPFNSLATNGEWEMCDYNVLQWNKSYLTGYYQMAGYTIDIKRQSMYYVMNVFGPVVVVSLLNILCFLLPVTSGDRVTLSISIFLTLTVFLVSVNDSLPKTSQGVSVCVAFIGSHMVGSALTIVMVVVIVCVESKDEETSSVLSPKLNKEQSLSTLDEEYLQLLNIWKENNDRISEILRGVKFSATQTNPKWKFKGLSGRINALCLWMGLLWNAVLLVVLIMYGYS